MVRRALPAVLCAAAALASAIPVSYTGSNTVAASRSGDGQGSVAAYAPSNIVYDLNSTEPDKIDAVTMTLDATPPAGSTISLQLRAGGAWYSCSNAGTSVTCPTTAGTQATVMTTDALRLITAD